MVNYLTPTQTLSRVQDGSRWYKAYRASWREYLDINGDGRLDRTEITFGVRAGMCDMYTCLYVHSVCLCVRMYVLGKT